MLINLQDYKEGDIVHVENTYDAKALEIEFVDLHYRKPLQLEGTVEKGMDLVTFRGQIKSETELEVISEAIIVFEGLFNISKKK